MRTRKTVRAGLSLSLLTMLVGLAQGCTGDPLGLDGDDPDPIECVWINGELHCSSS
jgi:hypothetical protein